jgi:hypothetical protein
MRAHTARTETDERRDAARRGLAAVEMALVLPAFLLLVFGIIEVSTIMRSWLTLQEAAETGARYASTGQGLDEGDRLARVVAETNRLLDTLPSGAHEVLVRSWPQSGGGAVENDAGGPCQMVEVEVRYAYEPMTAIMERILPDEIDLQSAVRKVNEPWNPCD